MAEPLTLYKLIILYMLKKVDFPLTNAQISEFVLDQEYTTYFTLQQAISELVEAGLIRMETIRNTSQYYLTEDGDMTLGYFTQRTSTAISRKTKWPSETKWPLSLTIIKIPQVNIPSTAKSRRKKAISWISPSAFPTKSRPSPCATTGANAARKSTNTSWGHYLQNRNPNKKMPGISWKALPGVFLFMYPLQILLNLFLIPVSAGAVEFGVTQFFGEVALAGEVFGEVVGIFVADAVAQFGGAWVVGIF